MGGAKKHSEYLAEGSWMTSGGMLEKADVGEESVDVCESGGETAIGVG